jgi:hypothetical protein
MSLLTQQVRANATTIVSGVGSGGGGGGPNLAVSTLSAAETVSTLSLNLQNINAVGQYPYRLRANSGSVFIEQPDGTGGDLVLSTITVSSINGAAPGGSAGPDPAFSTITLKGFPVPVQQFGSLSLDGGGSTTVSVDYTYADPWYPFACYKGIAPVTPAAPLFVSTLGADSFLVTGTPNLPIVWNTLGN